MIPLLALALAFLPVCTRPDVVYASGFFSLYGQSPTDGTIDYHQNVDGRLPQDMSPYAGVIAVIDDCSLVGRDAWIRLTDYHTPIEYWNHWLPVKIFDCGGHQESIENFFKPNNIIGELGYYIANDAGVYDLQRGIAGDLALEDPTMACATPTPISSPTPEPTETPTLAPPTPEPTETEYVQQYRLVTKWITVTPTPYGTPPVVAHISDDFDLWRDGLTAPMFTETQIVIGAALLATCIFSGSLFFYDLSIRIGNRLEKTQARLRQAGPAKGETRGGEKAIKKYPSSSRFRWRPFG